MRLPSGTDVPLGFADDGRPPDATANDGLFAALFPYNMDGEHIISVRFDNDAGTAALVSTAFEPSSGPNGEAVPLPAPVPVTQALTGNASIKLVVSGMALDDHGDTPANATAVAANNDRFVGKIDAAGDQDYFRLTTLDGETTYVRLTNLALGMKPMLRVLGADGSQELFQATLSLGYPYLYIPLADVAPGTTVYVEVSHAESAAGNGLYEFSAGPQLASDQIKLSHLYLPMSPAP